MLDNALWDFINTSYSCMYLYLYILTELVVTLIIVTDIKHIQSKLQLDWMNIF